ncbi:hypothetical protein Tco_0483527 [Tanacetum coccineum]
MFGEVSLSGDYPLQKNLEVAKLNELIWFDGGIYLASVRFRNNGDVVLEMEAMLMIKVSVEFMNLFGTYQLVLEVMISMLGSCFVVYETLLCFMRRILSILDNICNDVVLCCKWVGLSCSYTLILITHRSFLALQAANMVFKGCMLRHILCVVILFGWHHDFLESDPMVPSSVLPESRFNLFGPV